MHTVLSPPKKSQVELADFLKGVVVRASLLTQWERSHLSMQETQVLSLGREDRREKEMATHSSILAWRISWTEEPGGLHSMGSQRVRHD